MGLKLLLGLKLLIHLINILRELLRNSLTSYSSLHALLLTLDFLILLLFAIFPTSPEEVIEVRHLMKLTSSSGHDDINPTLHLVTEPLEVIFYSSFNTGIEPNLLQSAIVTPIYYKQGLRNEVGLSNYRPISILPYFYKLLEKNHVGLLTSI